jgi:hypothetical protein
MGVEKMRRGTTYKKALSHIKGGSRVIGGSRLGAGPKRRRLSRSPEKDVHQSVPIRG